ncbi:hypothetical protein BIY27_11400 [Gibbsiella quercinecans]|uniref:phage tail protein n=1 Tax=Gibbsiella quercinecans TaxID=929813 RepID=UPI000EF1F5A9|nr:phage tail protein [Gibbsiella quercinecans]RLM12562.1 hypothetical protein BIY27_11400 [Gibbsiella quercinecans]
MTKYNAILTNAGAKALAQASISGESVGFTQMAVGDGQITPIANMTGLVNELFRTQLNSLKISETDQNLIVAEMIMPPQVGGFTLREAALFGNDGTCLAVANLPETYKPLLAEGSGRLSIIRICLAVSSTENVVLITDPSIVMATIEDVQKVESAAKDYADNLAAEIDEATKNAIAAAVEGAIRDAWELDNPVGDVRFFNQNVNPNEKWPWSTWQYLGEDRVIRLAKADGSDVGATGGSDTITIGKDNLPNVQIDVSGTAAGVSLGTLDTTEAGGHTLKGKYAESNTSIDGGSSNRRSWAIDYGYSDEGLIEPVPNHIHQVTIPDHGHQVSGKTAALGAGSSINVTNKHIKLMAWHRTA